MYLLSKILKPRVFHNMSISKNNSKIITYKDAGVNIEAGNKLVKEIKTIVKKTKRPGIEGAIGGFGALFNIRKAGYKNPVLVSATDGVGTKIILAEEMKIYKFIGIDLVAMSVNDILVQGAEPLFFLDYLAISKLDIGKAKKIIEGIAKGSQIAGCALIGGETAELPDIYKKNTFDLAGFALGAIEKNNMLPKRNISKKDVIIALRSSGVHSNGFSLIRKIIKNRKLSFHDNLLDFTSKNLGEYLLTPTKIYVKPILNQNNLNNIKACAHITGGGLIDNLPRVIPNHLSATIYSEEIKPLPIFRWLKEIGNISTTEMLRTFNCGVGMCVIVSPPKVEKVLRNFNGMGEQAYVIGEISLKSDKKRINFTNKSNIWNF